MCRSSVEFRKYERSRVVSFSAACTFAASPAYAPGSDESSEWMASGFRSSAISACLHGIFPAWLDESAADRAWSVAWFGFAAAAVLSQPAYAWSKPGLMNSTEIAAALAGRPPQQIHEPPNQMLM